MSDREISDYWRSVVAEFEEDVWPVFVASQSKPRYNKSVIFLTWILAQRLAGPDGDKPPWEQ